MKTLIAVIFLSLISFAQEPYTVSMQPVYERESEKGEFTIDIKLDRPSPDKAVSLLIFTEDISTTVGEDYAPFWGEVLFEPGEVTKTINIQVLDDVQDEPDFETFRLVLISPTDEVVVSKHAIKLWILDDDQPAN